MEQSKACRRCQQILTLDNYFKHPTNADGLQSWCKECHRIRKIDNRINNREIYRSASRRRYAANPEAGRERALRYRLENPEKVKNTFKRWATLNPEKTRERNSRRRALMEKNGIYKVLDKEKRRLIYSPCFYCGSTLNIEIDHVIPISRGGRHCIGNLVSACKICNNRKRSAFVMEFRLKKSGVRRTLEQRERERNDRDTKS